MRPRIPAAKALQASGLAGALAFLLWAGVSVSGEARLDRAAWQLKFSRPAEIPFDAQDRLEVVNRRFFKIFGLSPDEIRPGTTFRRILEFSVASQNHAGRTVDDLLSEQANVRRYTNGTHFYELGDGRPDCADRRLSPQAGLP
jgi:PAS domain-containing protein